MPRTYTENGSEEDQENRDDSRGIFSFIPIIEFLYDTDKKRLIQLRRVVMVSLKIKVSLTG